MRRNKPSLIIIQSTGTTIKTGTHGKQPKGGLEPQDIHPLPAAGGRGHRKVTMLKNVEHNIRRHGGSHIDHRASAQDKTIKIAKPRDWSALELLPDDKNINTEGRRSQLLDQRPAPKNGQIAKAQSRSDQKQQEMVKKQRREHMDAPIQVSDARTAANRFQTRSVRQATQPTVSRTSTYDQAW